MLTEELKNATNVIIVCDFQRGDILKQIDRAASSPFILLERPRTICLWPMWTMDP